MSQNLAISASASQVKPWIWSHKSKKLTSIFSPSNIKISPCIHQTKLLVIEKIKCLTLLRTFSSSWFYYPKKTKRFHHDVIQFLFNISNGEKREKVKAIGLKETPKSRGENEHQSMRLSSFKCSFFSLLLRQNIAIKTDPSK